MIADLRKSVAKVIFGQDELVTEMLCCLFSGGHMLMTGAPGVAKTSLVRAVSNGLSLDFSRVQFTPDLLPSDIVGSEILAADRKSFDFLKGPIFTDLLLADEINRASPRTQSALLEAMAEKHVTISGHTYDLSSEFMVLATQNPFESEGTFPLPEAQLDRFMLHSLVPYPDKDTEMKVLRSHAEGRVSTQIDSPLSREQLQEIIHNVDKVEISEELIELVCELVRLTREPPTEESLYYGAGPRAGLSIISTSKALAYMDGASAVEWRHIESIVPAALRHRVKVVGMDSDVFISQLLSWMKDHHKLMAQGLR